MGGYLLGMQRGLGQSAESLKMLPMQLGVGGLTGPPLSTRSTGARLPSYVAIAIEYLVVF